MIKTSKYAHLRASVAPIILVTALLATPAIAQDVKQSPEAQGQAIIVTGSRIARPELESTVPLNVISEAAIARTGQTNVADVLRRQPIFSTGTSQGNSNFNTSGNGLNQLDLRGLGRDRTLVLVNGRRFVAGEGGHSSVDINMIPTDLVKRIETITGGASAIYGSDAMAGVVNFILKDDFEGIEMRGQSGISAHGDAAKYRLSGTVGTNFAGDRGNIWINGVYDKDEGLLSRKRSFSATDIFGRSVFAPQGAFNLNGTIFDITSFDDTGGGNLLDNDYTFDSDGNLKQGFVQNVDGFNRNSFRRISVPVERYLISSALKYDITDDITFYAEGMYGKTKSRAGLEGYPSAGGDPNVDGAGSIDVVGGLAIDNAYIPGPIAAEIAARNGDADATNDVGFIAFRRRLSDVFDRSNRNTRETYRFVAGLKGNLNDNWSWDVNYVYGHTTDFTASETVLTDRFTNALDAVNISGQIVCRDPAARADGCQPLNIFGANTAAQGAIDYIRGGRNVLNALSTTLEQQVASASMTGTLFTLPGGDVKVAFGAEYRKEKSIDDWDADTNIGNTLGNFTTDTRGSFHVADVFGEVSVPILSEVPLAHYLGVEGALRYDDYSTIGTVWSWKVGGDWAPTRDIRFRAVYSEASRAPNVSELFSAQEETFPGDLTLDPCNGVTAASNGTYDAACRAIPGIATTIANSGIFEYSQVEIQSINGFNGGNPNLQEETAKTWTVGSVFTPTFIPHFNMTVDYYHINVGGAINSQPRDETAKACLLDPNSAACGGLVFRLPNGKITRIDAFNINTGGFQTSDIDVGMNYWTDLDNWGRLDFQANYTRLLKHKRQAFTGGPFFNEIGLLQDSDQEHLGSGFKDRFVIDTIYSKGPVQLSWTVRYFGKIKDPNTDLTDEERNVGDAFYHDFQMRYSFDENDKDNPKSFYLGINNAFNRKPPSLPNGLTGSGLIGVETAQEYDAIGRYLYAGFAVKF
ncbi:MAG: TonB-dependent receptor [Alphaproteobacteria bacterium]|nr:TonB-dependent receptor [Alphaproteobacteria bacterium]